jgi:ribosomal small subunit protein bTHX
MGKGDRKTRRGKTASASYGNARPKSAAKKIASVTAKKPAAAAKPAAAKKAAPAKKAPAKKEG